MSSAAVITQLINHVDVGRQWYPITFLRDLCTYASWFKVSEFVSLSSRSKLPSACAVLIFRTYSTSTCPTT